MLFPFYPFFCGRHAYCSSVGIMSGFCIFAAKMKKYRGEVNLLLFIFTATSFVYFFLFFLGESKFFLNYIWALDSVDLQTERH